MARRRSSHPKSPIISEPKADDLPKTAPAEPAEPKLEAREVRRVRIINDPASDGSYITLDYIDGKLSEDDEFCGEHSCYRKNSPHGKLRWRCLSQMTIIFTCDSCRTAISFPRDYIRVPAPEIMLNPMTGQPEIITLHLCVKCGKELTPEDPLNMPNLCDECKNKGGGN